MLIIAKMKAKEASISRIVLEMWINQECQLFSGINWSYIWNKRRKILYFVENNAYNSICFLNALKQ